MKDTHISCRSGKINLFEKVTRQAILIGVGTVTSCSFAASLYWANIKGASKHAIRRQDLHFASNHDMGPCCTPPTILASSPTLTSAESSVHDKGIDIPINVRWNWLMHCFAFRRKTRASNESESSWFLGIKRTYLVLKRSLEIVIRLSPLLILAPTAMLVSRADLLLRGKPTTIGFGDNCSRLGEHSGEVAREDDEGDFIFLHRFDNTDNQQFGRCNTFDYSHENWATRLTWNYALYTLHSLGPAFVKLGQWAATRRDLFPVHVCNRLSGLHDMAKTHDWKHTHNALKEAFGDYESLGLVVTRSEDRSTSNPDGIIGSGSAAQVHKGTLVVKNSRTNATNTKMVAIKVLHPNTRSLVERDLELMQYTADLIDRFIPLEAVKMLSLPRAVANFSDVMKRQVDLRIEGENLHVFRNNFRCSENKSPKFIDFPEPENGWVSEKVLVEAHAGEDAAPISRYLADDSPDGLETRRKLAGPLLRAFLKMVFLDNFVHADLHPGNVLVREVTNATNPRDLHYTIIFLDAGIAMSLKDNDRKNLLDLFRAVVLNDGYTAGTLMVERARYEKCTSIPGGKHAFASEVSAIVSEFHDRRKKGLTLGAVRVGALLGRVLDHCRRYGVEIDPAMSSVVVSMLVLEGLGRSLDPDLNLIHAAMPFLLRRGAV